MTRMDEQGRPKPPVAGDETATLLGFLDFMRATLAWKCRGLDAAGLRATHPPTTMTLGGMLKHLACVEDDVMARWLLGRKPGPPWDAVGWESDPDWEWRTAADDSPEELWALWDGAVDRSRAAVGEALADGGLDHLGNYTNSRGESPTLRFILFTMIAAARRPRRPAPRVRRRAGRRVAPSDASCRWCGRRPGTRPTSRRG